MNIRPVAGFCLLGAALLFAQDWKTATTLPGVDLQGLTPAQKAAVLKAMRNNECTCGCRMKMAQCRVEDPGCTFSKGLATVIIDAVKQGKSETAAMAAVAASKFTPKLLDEPVTISTDGSPVNGPADARVTLVEFSDFQCPFCAKAIPQLEAILKAYPKQVKLIFKQYPLSNHPQASISAAASLAAQHQGKFWEMHNALFANRDKLSRKTIMELAMGLHLDMQRFVTDLDSAATKQIVAKDMADGDKAGVEATPTIFVDGRRYNGSLEVAAMKPVIEAELKLPPKK